MASGTVDGRSENPSSSPSSPLKSHFRRYIQQPQPHPTSRPRPVHLLSPLAHARRALAHIRDNHVDSIILGKRRACHGAQPSPPQQATHAPPHPPSYPAAPPRACRRVNLLPPRLLACRRCFMPPRAMPSRHASRLTRHSTRVKRPFPSNLKWRMHCAGQR